MGFTLLKYFYLIIFLNLIPNYFAFADNSSNPFFIQTFKSYEIEASKGSSLGQYNLAMAYYNGRGIKKNLYEAYKFLKLSADQVFAKAENSLGYLCKNGYKRFKNKL